MRIIILIFLIILLGCESTNSPNKTSDQKEIIVDGELFRNSPNDEYYIKEIKLIGNTLNLTVQYGGGCGEVYFNLYGSGALQMSNPPQTHLKLSLKDEDFCEALITKELIYDLTPLQSVNFNQIILNISGWSESILYTY